MKKEDIMYRITLLYTRFNNVIQRNTAITPLPRLAITCACKLLTDKRFEDRLSDEIKEKANKLSTHKGLEQIIEKSLRKNNSVRLRVNTSYDVLEISIEPIIKQRCPYDEHIEEIYLADKGGLLLITDLNEKLVKVTYPYKEISKYD